MPAQKQLLPWKPNKPLNELYRENTRINKCRLILHPFMSQEGCICCGEKEPAFLVFHHKDKSTKFANVSQLYHAKYVQQLIPEIEKCCICCIKCHMQIHAQKINNDKSTIVLPQQIKNQLFAL